MGFTKSGIPPIKPYSADQPAHTISVESLALINKGLDLLLNEVRREIVRCGNLEAAAEMVEHIVALHTARRELDEYNRGHRR